MVCLGLFVALLASAVQQVSATDGPATGWFGGGAPTIRRVAQVSVLDSLSTRCTWMTLRVHKPLWMGLGFNNQEYCMVNTAAGLVDKGGTVIQPAGYSEAFPISNLTAGRTAILPIPNQSAALLVQGDPAFPGVNIGIYQNLFAHLKFDILNQQFGLTDEPEVLLKYANGRLMNFNTNILSFSEDGRYFVTDLVAQGMVRYDLNTLQMMLFDTTLPITDGDGLLTAGVALDKTGQHVAVGFPGGWGLPYFHIIDLDTCSFTIADNPYAHSTFSCKTVDEQAALKAVSPMIIGVSSLKFANDHTLLTDVYNTNNTYVRYAITAAGYKESLVDYLALGDSYISGEGAYAYRQGTDTEVNKCHQSSLSYPYLLASKFSSSGSVACSGAVMRNITGSNDPNNPTDQLKKGTLITQSNDDTALTNYMPGYIAQNIFVSEYSPSAVTISIGGNDIGFKDIIQRCVVPFNNLSSTSQNCYQTYEDRLELVNLINNQFNNLVNTYKTVKSNSDRRVYVVGYPQIVSTTGICTPNVRLSQSDREFAVQLVSYLDSVIAKAAAKAGVYYVDTQDALNGHRLCDISTEPAMNGLTKGDDTWFGLANESYHPNALGQELLGNAIAAQTHDLQADMPVADSTLQAPVANPDLAILQAPKLNRTVYEILSAGQEVAQTVSGGLAPIDVPNFTQVLSPGDVLEAVLHSDPVSLGTVTVDASHQVHAQLQLPANTVPGFHTIHLYGHNLAGTPVDIQQTVYVGASATDTDGDGIANGVDSCLGVPNAGTDSDGDGVDDACDSTFSPPAPAASVVSPAENTPSTVPAETQNIPVPATTVTPGVVAPAVQLQAAAVSLQPSVAVEEASTTQAASLAVEAPNAPQVLGASSDSGSVSTAAAAMQKPATITPAKIRTKTSGYVVPLSVVAVVLSVASLLFGIRKLRHS